MSTKRITLLIGSGAVETRLWCDGDATLASVDAGDGVSAPREELAQVLESLAAYVRTGEVGPLPQGVIPLDGKR